MSMSPHCRWKHQSFEEQVSFSPERQMMMPRHRKVKRNRTSTCELGKGVAVAAVAAAEEVAEVVEEVPWEGLGVDKRLHEDDKGPLLGQ